MRISMSIERLRIWLLVGAGLLVMVIAAFLGYAHYRAGGPYVRGGSYARGYVRPVPRASYRPRTFDHRHR